MELPKLTFIEQVVIDGRKYNPFSISHWLKSKGLKHDEDYTWWYDHFSQEHGQQVIIFRFRDARWCSLLALKYP